MYLYTLLKQDGTQEELAQLPEEATLKQLYEWLDCTTVELIPQAYYKDEWQGRAIVWGDEEGRFKDGNHRNPHTKVIGSPFGYADCVGDLVLAEEV